MNKENSYSNLGKWCEQYHEKSKIKVHPSSVPVDLVLEDVLGYIAHLRSNVNMLMMGVDEALKQIATLQEQMTQSAELHAQTTKQLNDSTEMLLNKQAEQVKRTSTKKEK